MLPTQLSPRQPASYNLGRHPPYYGKIGNILVHDRSSRHNCPTAYSDPLQNNSVGANPIVAGEYDVLVIPRKLLIITNGRHRTIQDINPVIPGDYRDMWTEKYVISQNQLSLCCQDAYMRAQVDIVAYENIGVANYLAVLPDPEPKAA